MEPDKKRIPTSLKALAVAAVVLAAAAAIVLPIYWDEITSSGATEPIGANGDPIDETDPDEQQDSIDADIDAAGTGYRVGDRAPLFTLETLDGQAVSLANFRGRVVILDFWASWCAPCRASMPHIEGLAARFDDNVVLLGVSLDRTRRAAASYLDTLNSPHMLAVWGSYAKATEVARRYGVIGIPRTFVIDQGGIVRYAGHPTRLRAADIDALLAD
jgi:thiol-disulfide isomerase/thioredoxin